MTAIKILDLNNAKRDLDHIAAVATSTASSATDRLGHIKPTLYAALLKIGYAVPVAYTSGLVMTLGTQTVEYNDIVYAPLMSQLPFTTSGAFEASKFRVVQGVTFEDLTALNTAFRSSTVNRKLLERVSVADLGGDSTGGDDCLDALMAAWDEADEVWLTKGIWRFDEMIEPPEGKALRLAVGAFPKRFATHSASKDPLVWIKNRSSGVIGPGQSLARFITENRCPRGIIRIGHKDMTESHANVTWCTAWGFSVQGRQAYGLTGSDADAEEAGAGIPNDPDVGLYLPNPQIGDIASYFHEIGRIQIMDVNKGLHLHGWANANMISRLQGYRIGNVHSPDAAGDCFIHVDGALDLNIDKAFLHFSPNTTGLRVDEYDNTGNGGAVHTPYANEIHGLIFEQGGPNAYGAKITAGTGSNYSIRSNCALGDQLFAGFHASNTLEPINGSNYSRGRSLPERIGLDQSAAGEAQEKVRYLKYTSMSEGATYKIVDLPVGAGFGAMIELEFYATAGAGINFQGGGKVVYTLQRTAAGTLTAHALLSRYSGSVAPCVPIISGGICTIAFKVADNGTGTSVFGLGITVKVMSAFNNSGEPTWYTTETVSGTDGTPLSASI